MNGPIVVLADPDAKYLRSLELKFLEEMSGKIELELINEEEYFRQHFQNPQTIDVLLIDEKWYREDLAQHNIGHIFILGDSRSAIIAKRTGQYIFKYSSSSEIYRTVLRSMEGKFLRQSEEKHKTQVVTITSASGGTGKTTLALGLAANLASRMQRVLYVDAEQMNVFQYRLKDKEYLPDSVYTALQYDMTGVYAQVKGYLSHELFDYLPPLKAALVTLGIPQKFYRTLISEAKESGDYDAIVIDTDMIFDEEKAFYMTYSDILLTVLKQTKSSVCAVNELLKNVRMHSSEKYLFICNDFDESKPNALLDLQEELSFMVNEYVHHMEKCDEISLSELKNERNIQKISYLLI